MSARAILLLSAVVLCVLAAFGVDPSPDFQLFPLGVAAGFGAFLVG